MSLSSNEANLDFLSLESRERIDRFLIAFSVLSRNTMLGLKNPT